VVNRKNYCKNCLKDKVEEKVELKPSVLPHQQQQQSTNFSVLDTSGLRMRKGERKKLGITTLGLFIVSILLIVLGYTPLAGPSKNNAILGLGWLLFVFTLFLGAFFILIPEHNEKKEGETL
jgi:hypothetical protein